jgi:hypothetical protein
VLTRSRFAALAGLSLVLAVVASAPAAWGSAAFAGVTAASARQAAHAAHFPAAAKARLSRELSQAWQISRGQGVTIAVLTTAVDAVTGLAGKLTHGPDFAPLTGAPAIDGTILASLIAGSGPTGTNPFGTIGRAPGAKILAEQMVDYGAGRRGLKYQQDRTWQSLAAKAIRYAVNHGASVIVNTEFGYTDTSALDSAVAYAISRKVVVLGSDGVFGRTPNAPSYPDSLPGVIDFSGVTLSGLPTPPRAVRSPVNDSVLLAAPGNILYATGPGNAPYYAWGSNSTIAWVAGTVALLKSVYPQITPAQVARALAESASYHPAGGYNTTVGFGLINPAGALHDASALVKLGTSAASGAGTVSASARFGTSQPGVIEAVPHATAKVAGFSATIVVGLIMLVLAINPAVRRRRRADTVRAGTVRVG